jgi:hypothetical protein
MGLLGLLLIVLLAVWLLGHVAIGPLVLIFVIVLLVVLASGGYTRRGWY